MKKLRIENIEYSIVEDYKNGFDKEEVSSKMTDYFFPYDYIVGDWSYGKLRLKGFCTKENPIYKPYNDFEQYKEYLKNECAYDCKYFVLKKME